MTLFQYQALDRHNGVTRGTIDAMDKTAAIKTLIQEGKKPFDLSELPTARGPVGGPQARSLRSGKVNFGRLFTDLHVLLDAGFSLDGALSAAAQSLTERQGKADILGLVDRLKSGEALSQALTNLPEVPANIAALIATGEAAGRLETVIFSLSKRLDAAEKRRTEVIEAAIYPLFLLAVMLTALVMITFILVPALAPIFEGNTSQQMPMMIGILSALRSVLVSNSNLILAGFALMISSLFLTYQRREARLAWSRIFFQLPFFGRLLTNRSNEQYLETLALLLGNGIAMGKALELSSDVVPQPESSAKLSKIRDQVVSGARLRDAMKASGIFNEITLSLVSIGDDANQLPQSLQRAAMLLAEENRKAIKRFLAILSPSMTILTGLLVGTLVISVMNALLSLNDLTLQ